MPLDVRQQIMTNLRLLPAAVAALWFAERTVRTRSALDAVGPFAPTGRIHRRGFGQPRSGRASAAPPSTLPRPWTVQHCRPKRADLITRRVWSHLWALDETAWQTDVQPVVDALRALTAGPPAATGRMMVTVLQRA